MKKVDDYIKEKAVVVKKIIEYRIQQDLSQLQLAEEIGVTQEDVSKIEEGEFFNLNTIENILHHIGYRLKLGAVPL